MRMPLIVALSLALIGCEGSRTQHIRQIQRAVQDHGGESELLKESEELFARCRTAGACGPLMAASHTPALANLPCILSLGDVFYYRPGRVDVRVHNSHFDTFWLSLFDPDQQLPASFDPIIGNVGFLDP